jgi:hypothetical protein
MENMQMSSRTNKLYIANSVESLRALCRYETHGGYAWAGIMGDAELLCVPCLRANYRQVFRATKADASAGYGTDWQLIGYENIGESEETEYCAHCNKPIWEAL